jgi:hypothetical protein
MKLLIFVFNKNQVLAAFLPQAIRIAELFGCEIDIRYLAPRSVLPEGMDFLPLHTGQIAELEIWVQGDAAPEAMTAIRRCMAQCYGEADYQVN